MAVDPSDIRQVPEVPIAPETRLERLEKLTKLGQRALVERCDQMSGPPEPTKKVALYGFRGGGEQSRQEDPE